MKKTILFLILIPLSITAQQTAQFESKVFFEDAKGHRDTIIIGYDTTATDYNPQFGEKNITESWDSLFEVRATHKQGYFTDEKPSFFSKKIVASTKGPTHPKFFCPPAKASILFFTYTKYFPLKVTWEIQDHANFCNFGNVIINNIGPWFFPDWHKGMPKDQYRCMSQDSVFILPKNLKDNYNFYFKDTLKNGKKDSIMGLMLYFAYKGAFFSNCGIVSIDDAFSSFFVNIYPNPAHDILNVSVAESDEQLQIECFDLQGRAIYRCDFQHFTQVNTADWQRGLYAIVIRDTRGRLVKSDKVIIE